MGADIPDSTLAGWCGGAMRTLGPLVELIRAEVLACDRSTAWRRWQLALTKIASRLNA